MPAIVARAVEREAIHRFLLRLRDGAALLVLEGEAGIGKTTLIRAAMDAATNQDATVLSCAGSLAEARLAYAGLADLIGALPEDAFAGLAPAPRAALDAALLRAQAADDVDARAVAVGTLEVVGRLAAAGPVVLAVDDLQWLDAPSARVLSFCARRLPAGAGLVCSRRLDGDGPPPQELLGLGDPEDLEVVAVGPLGPAALRAVLTRRAQHPLAPSLLDRIQRVSGGNPFHALELAGAGGPGLPGLPESLDDALAAGAAGLGEATDELLLALAALAAPRLDTLERLFGAEVAERLAPAEQRGLVRTDGATARFTHPLLAEGVYRRATLAARREVHRRLAAVVDTPEERARHLAAGRAPEAVDALTEAAAAVRARGAPDAAAELLELALELGAAVEVAVRAAELRLDSGDQHRARELLESAVAELPPGHRRAEALMLLGEIAYKTDSYPAGRERLERALAEPDVDARLRAMIELRLGFVQFNSPGGIAEAAATAEVALARAEGCGDPALLAQALAASAICDYGVGRGLDRGRLDRALALEDPGMRGGAELAPTIIAAFVLGWSGALTEAQGCVDRVRRRYADRGEQQALAWSGYAAVTIDCWRGAVPAADAMIGRVTAEMDALGTVNGRALAAGTRLVVDGYAGRVQAARAGFERAHALFAASTWDLGYVAPMALGLLELSLDEHARAAAVLEPLAALVLAHGVAEPTVAGAFFLGDAAEALIGRGDPEAAQPVVALLEERGATLDRPWATAVGARCRGLLHAAAGDLDAAGAALERALVQHVRIEMPVEHARSLLMQGRLLRRQRRRAAARAALEQATAMFAAAGTPRWAERAQAEIAALGLQRTAADQLTPAEARVARLAADGLSNREVAARLVLSPKTVEAHLGRAYRKLSVSSRIQLARSLDA